MRTASQAAEPCPEDGQKANVLILGTAEWDSPIATNQHYVARELAQVANITYVESLGLRTPTLSRADVGRMASRLRRAFGPKTESASAHSRPRPPGAKVLSPVVIPVHRTPTYPINRALLRRTTAEWLASAGPRVLWTFTPVTYGLESAADVVIYHCVDLLGSFPGVDATAVSRGERSLSKGATLAIATSKAVEQHLERAGFPHLIMLPNVADVSTFADASQPSEARRPVALFSGNLSAHKLDVALLESLAVALQGKGELCLAGPIAAGGGSFGEELRRLEAKGARYLGLLSQAELAKVAGTCSVGLIPYAINEYTRGVSPLKCFEYLSSGLSVLSTALPSVTDVANEVPHVTVSTAEQMASQLVESIRPAADEVIRDRMDAAAEHGWDSRGRLLRDLLAAELARLPEVHAS